MEGSAHIEEQEEQTIDLNMILTKCKRHWYWFVIGLALAGSVAYFYTWFTTPVYQASAELLIKEDKGSPSAGLQNDVLAQLNFLTGNSNVLNEIPILESRTIVGRAIRDLGLQSTYWVEGRYKNKEIYKHTPVLITPVFLKDSVKGAVIQVQLNSDHTFTLADEDSNRAKATDGSTVSLGSGTFFVKRNPAASDDSIRQVLVKVSSLPKTVTDFQKNHLLIMNS